MRLLRRLFPCLLLPAALSAQPLQLGPERRLVPPARIVPGQVAPGAPGIASNGDSFFAIFDDGRRGTRISAAGETLDRPALTLDAAELTYGTAVVWDGTSFVLAWLGPFDLRLGRFDAETAAVAPLVTIATAGLTHPGSGVHLATNGRHLATAHGLQHPLQSVVHIHDADGRVLFTSMFQGSVADIASDGSNFLVLAEGSAILLSERGTVVWRVALPSHCVSATYSGGEFLISAETAGSPVLVRLSAGGVTSESPFPGAGQIASDGLNVVAVWKQSVLSDVASRIPWVSSLHAASASLSGGAPTTELTVTLDEATGLLSAPADPPAIATNGDVYVIVWTEGTSVGHADREVHSLALRAGEAVSGEEFARRRRFVATRYAPRSDVAVAPNGANALVLWWEPPGLALNDSVIAATRMTPAGVSLDGSGFTIATRAPTRPPSASWNGTDTVLVWEASGRIEAAFIGRDGTPSDVILVSATGRAPQLACGEGACLVVWLDNRAAESNDRELYAARLIGRTVVDLHGVLLGRVQVHLANDDYTVASDGATSFLVAWHDRLRPSGSILRSAFITNPRAGFTTRHQDLAAAPDRYTGARGVWDGQRFAIFWTESYVLPPATVRATRLSGDGWSVDGDATGWRGVVVDTRPFRHLSAAGDSYYLTTVDGIVRLDGTTLQVSGAAEWRSAPSTGIVYAFGPSTLFAIYARDGEIMHRRLGVVRGRAVGR